MTALSAEKAINREVWHDRTFTAKSGEYIYKGAIVAIELGGGYVVEATGAADEIVIGLAMKTIDATSAAKSIPVRLFKPIEVTYFANGSSIVAADLGAVCFASDDNTVTLATTGRPFGRVWAVDSVRGVAVEPFAVAPGIGTVLLEAPTYTYTANDYAVADYPVSGTVFDVATTGANSTISLPANAREGTILYFFADGTKNGHTITYRDVATAISAAATASKRHLAQAVFLNSKWAVTLTVGP